MRKFKVFVTWEMGHEIDVEAESVDEAIRKVENDEVTVNTKTEGEYIDSSFEVDSELTTDFAEAEVNHLFIDEKCPVCDKKIPPHTTDGKVCKGCGYKFTIDGPCPNYESGIVCDCKFCTSKRK